MELERAIEILVNLDLRRRGVWFVGELEALKLAIEASKARKERQEHISLQLRSLLPGETKED